METLRTSAQAGTEGAGVTFAREIEAALIEAGLAGGKPAPTPSAPYPASELARFREIERQQEFARQAEAAREAEAMRQRQLEIARQLERFREQERQREEQRRRDAERARQEQLRRQEAARRAALAREQAIEAERARQRAADAAARAEREGSEQARRAALAREREVRFERERAAARNAGPTSAVVDPAREEQRVQERVGSLRRAFAVVPDGPKHLAAIERLADAAGRIGRGLPAEEERLFEAALAEDAAASRSTAGRLSGATRPDLRSRSAGEAKALIRQEAAKIPLGETALDAILDERQLKVLNDDAALPSAPHPPRRPEHNPDDELTAERVLSDRNEALRRAFRVVNGGEGALEAIELMATGGPANRVLDPDEEERLFSAALAEDERAAAAGPPSIVDEARRALEEEDAAEREALIMEIASKIPMGVEAVESFREEKRLREQRDFERGLFLSIPGGAQILEERDALIADTRRRLQEVVPELGPQARGPSQAELRAEAREVLGLEPLSDDEREAFLSSVADLAEEARPGRPFVPEIVIELMRKQWRGEDFTEAEVRLLNGFSNEIRHRGWAIALSEDLGTSTTKPQAERLRAGTELSDRERLFIATNFFAEQIDRATGGPLLRGASLNPPSIDDPLRPLRGAGSAFLDPSSAQAIDIGPLRHLPDNAIPGTEIGLDDVAAFGLDAALGLDGLLPGGTLRSLGSAGIDAGRAANGVFDEDVIRLFDPQAANRARSAGPGAGFIPDNFHPDVPSHRSASAVTVVEPESRARAFVSTVVLPALKAMVGRGSEAIGEIAAKWQSVVAVRKALTGLLSVEQGSFLDSVMALAENSIKTLIGAHESARALNAFLEEDWPEIAAEWSRRADGLASGSIGTTDEALESMRPVLQQAIERKLTVDAAPGALNSSSSMVDDVLVFIRAASKANSNLNRAIGLMDLAARGAIRGPLQADEES